MVGDTPHARRLRAILGTERHLTIGGPSLIMAALLFPIGNAICLVGLVSNVYNPTMFTHDMKVAHAHQYRNR
jgi:hypothetical protein